MRRVTFMACVLFIGVPLLAKAQCYQYYVNPPGAPLRMQTALSCGRPAYPLDAQAQRMQGLGWFQITVRRDGYVHSVKVTKSSGHIVLDQAGVTALRTWRFPHGAPKIIRVPIVWTMGTIEEYAKKHPWRAPKSLGVGDGDWIIITER